MATEFTCTHCGSLARSGKDLAPGTAIRCPKCKEVFRLPGEEARVQPKPSPAPPATKPVRRESARYEDDRDEPVRQRRRPDDDPPPERRRRDRRDDDDHDDDDYDRPRKKKKKKPAKSSTVLNLVIIGGVVGAIMIVIVGAVIYAVWSGARGNVSSRPIATVPFPGGPNVARPGGPGMPGPGGAGGQPEVQQASSVHLADTRPLIGPNSGKFTKRPSDAAPPSAPNGQLARDVLDRVKRATVYIRVTSTDGKGLSSGSGFFGGSKDLVLTNAHVVGMMQSEAAPSQIDVVLHSGETNETTFVGEVLTVDRGSDLAVLRVKAQAGKGNLTRPDPLTVAPGYPQETQQVFIFGFPLGEQLGKAITVAPSSVSSLRKDPEGALDQIQVNGGMHHGNSGGPVVDAAGRLVGVAVAGIEGTQINFAVPAERVGNILDGRLATITTGEPEVRGDQIVVPIEITSLDPLSRIRDLKLDWWWGNSDMKVPAAMGAAPQLAGHSTARTSISFKTNALNRFTAEVSVPKSIPVNQLLWVQPHYNSADGRVYMQGVEKEVEAPPEARGTTLTYRPQLGNSTVDMQSANRINANDSKGEGHSALFNIVTTLAEQTTQATQEGASMQVRFGKIEMGVSIDNRPPPRTKADEQAFQSIGKSVIDMNYDRQGNVSFGRPNLNAVPQDHRPVIELTTMQVAHSLNFGSIPFPNRPVTVGQTWQGQRQLPIAAGENNFLLAVDLTYTYKGIRMVNGREMAEISLAGRVDNPGSVSGTAVGKVLVDVAAGRVAKAHVVVLSTMSFRLLNESLQARSHLTVKWTRR